MNLSNSFISCHVWLAFLWGGVLFFVPPFNVPFVVAVAAVRVSFLFF